MEAEALEVNNPEAEANSKVECSLEHGDKSTKHLWCFHTLDHNSLLLTRKQDVLDKTITWRETITFLLLHMIQTKQTQGGGRPSIGGMLVLLSRFSRVELFRFSLQTSLLVLS